MFIVFDLDGTLSNPAHRVHHLEGDQKDWDAFYEACGGDKPHLEMLELFQSLRGLGNRIEIWTGRRESTREKTNRWFEGHGIELDHFDRPVRLIMRGDNDFRHDVETKGEWIERRGVPDIVFEDRNSMVEFYRSQGIRCLQVAPGYF